jgi:tungstate transport system substrate-binding protein
LATTTTTVDSGLLPSILPAFEHTYDARVDVIAVGTGEALALGRAGDVDVVLVHARPAEDEFVAAGYGINRRDVMFNDFILLGPPADPAGVRGWTDPVAALLQIRAARALFASRGDQSGTHARERTLWAAAGVQPQGDWYQEVGQGMGATLTIASEKRAYTLSDRGTFIARQTRGIDLEIMVEGDSRLLNPYGIIAINPELHDGINGEMAARFIEWITSAGTQAAINALRIDGQQLFFGNADP